jgi:hypothetical protein
MPASIRPLSPPHKGLRNALGLLSCYSGTCDYADLASVQRFRQCASDFHALCIDHEANEERYVFEPLVQELFSDAELQGHQIAIMQKTTSDLLLLWFKYIVPARQLSENLQVLTPYHASVPQEQFDIVMKQIERAMDPNSFHVLNRALNG